MHQNTDQPRPQKASEVFTPNDFPRHTYVSRASRKYEERLRGVFDIPNTIAVVSGPSKSGKTILTRRVVGDSNLITVACGGIKSNEDLWNRVLDRLKAPAAVSQSRTKESGVALSGEVSGTLFPTANNVAKVALQYSNRTITSQTVQIGRRGLSQISEILSHQDVVLLLDDFHFIPRDVQPDIATELKGLASDGVRIALTVAAHRTDDLERATSQLTGRVGNVAISPWTRDELLEIAYEGFPLLNVAGNILLPHELVSESAGSPQLMQLICLKTALHAGFGTKAEVPTALHLRKDDVQSIMRESTTFTNRETVASTMLNGPKARGTPRDKYKLNDGSSGDVYYCITKVLVLDPPRLEHQYEDIKSRIEGMIRGEYPSGASITSALDQMCALTMEPTSGEKVLDWDAVKRRLNIVDPYLWFYLRWSPFLSESCV